MATTTKADAPLLQAPPAHPPLQGPIVLPKWNPYRGRVCCKGLVMDPKWRIACLTLMGMTLIILVVAVMSTGWREDQEDRYNVFITHGLWRVCRDITFGSTVDHACASSFANEAPDWFQSVRAFMLMAVVSSFVGFIYSVYLVATMPAIKNPKYPNQTVSLAFPGMLYLVAAVCVLVGSSTYSVATAMDQALYFPENLPPTWGNSWAEVLAKSNAIPSDMPDVQDMKMKYGYSFGLAWLSFFTTTTSFIVTFVASGAN